MSLRYFLTISLVLISTACFAAETAVSTPTASTSKTPGVEAGDKKTDQKKAGKNGKNGKRNGKGQGGRGKGGGKVCKADREMYCKGINGRPERRACLLKNKEILSAGCKEFMEKQNGDKSGKDKNSVAPAGKIGTAKNADDKVEVNKAAVPAATTPAAKTPAAPAATKEPAKK